MLPSLRLPLCMPIISFFHLQNLPFIILDTTLGSMLLHLYGSFPEQSKYIQYDVYVRAILI